MKKKAGRRHVMGVGISGSSLFCDWIYLAENVCRPAAQNVMGDKEIIRNREQAMGDGVRKAGGGPK